jgi:hypothetical protein
MNLRNKVAAAIVEEIAQNLNHPDLGKPEFALGIFQRMCVQFRFRPSEDDARRVFRRVLQEMTLRQQIAGAHLLVAKALQEELAWRRN